MKYKLASIVLIIFLTASVSAENLQMELKDATGSTVNAEYRVLQDGKVLNSSTDLLDVNLTGNENYTVEQKASTSAGWYNVTYHDLNVTQDLDPKTQLVNPGIPDDKTFLTDLSKSYMVQTSNLEFSKAEIRITSPESRNSIAHCLSFDFSTSTCNSWEINSTSQYSTSYSSGVLEFNVTEFDGYAAGDTAPLPNITEIRIYDVTDTMDNRQGGTLVEKGLNDSFKVEQHDPSEYRFEFQVFNNGSENWDIAGEDVMREEGLDPGWTVSDVFYELGDVFEGGSFSNGDISWKTQDGGILETSGTNSTLEANFVLDLSLGDTVKTENLFEVNDTSDGTGTSADHSVTWRKLGDLNVSLEEPPNSTVVSGNHFFTVNATAECLNGYCGDVDLTPRYNTTEGYAKIPEGSGTPFYTRNSPRKACGDLNASETCSVTWEVNATGPVESWHRIDANASSNYSEIPEKSSPYSEIQINQMIMMNLTWEQTNFGYIDPGENNKPAEGNDEGLYNITIGEKSMNIDELWVKGADLISERNSDYRIGITNLSMTTDLSQTNHTVSNSYKRLLQDISQGTSINTKYWLDAPTGITQGAYTGNITFKANATY